MATPKRVNGQLLDGSGNGVAGIVVAKMLSLAFVNAGEVVPREVRAIAAADGTYSFDPAAAVPNGLFSNADLTPANTYWSIVEVANGVPYPPFGIVVPNTAGPFVMNALVVSSPALPAQYVIAGAAGIAAADGTIVIGGTVPAPTVKVGTIAQGQVTGLPAIAASQVTDEAAIAANTAAVALRAIKPLVGDATLYVSASGSDANDGLSAGSAKLTIQAAIAALPQQGGQSVGKVMVGKGTWNVASTGRTATVTVTTGSTTVIDATCTSADVGAYMGGYVGGNDMKILTVNAGVSFTVSIAPTQNGAQAVFITHPGLYVPAGVTIEGVASSYSDLNETIVDPAGGDILPCLTKIQDTGTGVTILLQSAFYLVGKSASRISLKNLAVWGTSANMVGLASLNGMWFLVAENCDFSYHGWAGVGMGDGMCQSEFRSCVFAFNGTPAATKPTGGVLMWMDAGDGLGSIVYTNCLWNGNCGIGLGAGAPHHWDGIGFATAGATTLISGQFTGAVTTTIANSGTHCWLNNKPTGASSAIIGTGFFGNCVNNLLSSGPLPVIGALFGGPANTNNVVLKGDGFSAIGCIFGGPCAQSIISNGFKFSWQGCTSDDTVWSGTIPASAAKEMGTAGMIYTGADTSLRPSGVASTALNAHNNASAVNGLQVTGTATSVPPILSPIGDAAIGLVITGKGNTLASRVQVQSSGAAVPTLEYKLVAGQTAHAWDLSSAAGAAGDIAYLRADGYLAVSGGFIDLTAANHLYLTGGGLYVDGWTQVVMRDASNVNAAIGTFKTTGMTLVGGVGFWGHVVQPSKPSVTGSRSANAALASLLTALDATGILTDSSTV